MSLSDLLSVVIPSEPCYRAPDAPPQPEPIFRIIPSRPHSPRTMRKKKSRVKLKQEHLDDIMCLLSQRRMSTVEIDRQMPALATSSVLCALHSLEDSERIMRVGSEQRSGAPIIWGLRP